jgi:GNAT superfamily N-acetyltransferase
MIKQFEKTEAQACINVINSAFAQDPLYTKALKTEQEKQVFSEFMINKAMALDENVVVFKEADVIKGVASFERNSGKPFQTILSVLRIRFFKEVIQLFRRTTPGTLKFFNQYMKYTTSERPKKPHHYLVFIGVESRAQGQGIGRALLEAVHKIVDEDKESIGIGLDTENIENIRYYEKFGYQLISQKTIEQVTIYAMFRWS